MAQLIVSGVTTAATSLIGAVPEFLSSQLVNIGTSLAANAAKDALFGARKRKITGPRLEGLRIQATAEGTPITRLFGTARLGGQIIWASDFREERQVTRGGKGAPDTERYVYTVSVAIGLCEGEISAVHRCWVDGVVRPLGQFAHRLYKGSNTQAPDPLIAMIEGEENTPAFRGLAYILFEDLPLAEFGNRLPLFSFEVERPIHKDKPGIIEKNLTAVCMLPGSGEFAYAPEIVEHIREEGVSNAENMQNAQARPNLEVSLDNLHASLPECKRSALIVSWFADSLDANKILIRPGVEQKDKRTSPYSWRAGGMEREQAYLVSRDPLAQGDAHIPSYGGTPDDRSVTGAIKSMHERGMDVLFYPFLLMDNRQERAYGWRGEIKPYTDIDAGMRRFFGQARAEDFRHTDENTVFTGPGDAWSWSRMILHYAWLCKKAGGVEAFLIGSEFRDITRSIDSAGTFLAVAHLKRLAGEVRKILGEECKISYAADWSEYGAQLIDGDLRFPLDPLWADTNIDFIGIDNYQPLSDWREGGAHLDAAEARRTDELAYLQANIRGGENYDWYYATPEDRNAQRRTPIKDTAHAQDWVFRSKDLWGFWQNAHYERFAGVQSATPTAWQPQSKPFWFCELGCPAIDKGANQPNVFYDEKSALSALPYFSTGRRDDKIQRAFIEAHLDFWNDTENNPLSGQYDGRMVSVEHMYIYCWDARPYPYFPLLTSVWRDGSNWYRGHWISGRFSTSDLGSLVAEIFASAGLDAYDVSLLRAPIKGYVIDRPMSYREILEPLAAVYQFDFVQSGTHITCIPHAALPALQVPENALLDAQADRFTLERKQPEDLPVGMDFSHYDPYTNYTTCVSRHTALDEKGTGHAQVAYPIVMDPEEGAQRCRSIITAARHAKEKITLALPLRYIFLEPSDRIHITLAGRERTCMITRMFVDTTLFVEATTIAPPLEGVAQPIRNERNYRPAIAPIYAQPALRILDLPVTEHTEAGKLHAAAFMRPWPGRIAVSIRESELEWRKILEIERPATLGRLTQPLAAGPPGRMDDANRVRVRLSSGMLAPTSLAGLYAGRNSLCVACANKEWEILQFLKADLEEDNVYLLRGLLRARGGSETAMHAGAEAGATIVLLDDRVTSFAVDSAYMQSETAYNVTHPYSRPDSSPEKTFRYEGICYRPLAPVHVRHVWDGDMLQIRWTRRGRIGADNWRLADIPLDEPTQSYAIELRFGSAPLQRFTSDVPYFAFTPDAGSRTAMISGDAEIRIAQISPLYGAGTPAIYRLS